MRKAHAKSIMKLVKASSSMSDLEQVIAAHGDSMDAIAVTSVLTHAARLLALHGSISRPSYGPVSSDCSIRSGSMISSDESRTGTSSAITSTSSPVSTNSSSSFDASSISQRPSSSTDTGANGSITSSSNASSSNGTLSTDSTYSSSHEASIDGRDSPVTITSSRVTPADTNHPSSSNTSTSTSSSTHDAGPATTSTTSTSSTSSSSNTRGGVATLDTGPASTSYASSSNNSGYRTSSAAQRRSLDTGPANTSDAGSSRDDIQHPQPEATTSYASNSTTSDYSTSSAAQRRFLDAHVAPLLRSKVESLDGVGLSLCLHALAKMGHRDEQLVGAMLWAAGSAMDQMSPRELGQMLWALVRLKHTPPPEFVEPLLERALMCMRSANAQDCSLLLWGLAKCGCGAPGYEWMGQFCARTLQLLPDMTDQTISNILYGLAALRIMPSDNYLRTLLAAAQQLLPSFSPEAFGMTAYALAILCFDPGGAWRRSFMAASLQVLPGCSAHNFVSLAMLLSQWRVQQPRPPDAWLDEFFVHSHRQMGRFSAQGLAVMGCALASIHVRPPTHWLHSYCQAALAANAPSTPPGCAGILHALGAWGFAPPAALAKACVQALVMRSGRFSGRQLAMAAGGLARLGVRPSEGLVEQLMEDMDAKLHTYSPQALASFTWALAAWSTPPPQPWLAKTLALFSHRISGAGPAGLLQMAGALASLRGLGCRQLPAGFLTRLCLAADVLKSEMAPAELAALLLALGRLLGYGHAAGVGRRRSSSIIGGRSSSNGDGSGSGSSSSSSGSSSGSRSSGYVGSSDNIHSSKAVKQRCIRSMFEALAWSPEGAAADAAADAAVALRAMAAAAACSAAFEPDGAAELLLATQGHLSQMTGPQLLAVAQYAAHLPCVPPPLSWQLAFLEASEHQLLCLDVQQLASIRAALAALHIALPQHWAASYEAAAVAALARQQQNDGLNAAASRNMADGSNGQQPAKAQLEVLLQRSQSAGPDEPNGSAASAVAGNGSAAVALLLASKHKPSAGAAVMAET